MDEADEDQAQPATQWTRSDIQKSKGSQLGVLKIFTVSLCLSTTSLLTVRSESLDDVRRERCRKKKSTIRRSNFQKLKNSAITGIIPNLYPRGGYHSLKTINCNGTFHFLYSFIANIKVALVKNATITRNIRILQS